MRISKKGRYALHMMIDLAEHRYEGFVALKEIANRQNISKKYLEQIVPVFHKDNLLKTNRGFQGGYMLARTPDKYTVGDILRLTEGSMSPVDLADITENPSAGSGERALLPVWEELDRLINRYLDSVTLQDILDMRQEQYGNDYVI